MNKKVVIPILYFLVLTIFGSMFVSAAPDLTTIVSGVQDFFTPILKALFGETAHLFEQLLFALLIIAVVYMALEQAPVIKNNSFALWTLAIASAILAVRYIATEGLVNLLLLPQGVLGVALLTIIPFVIFFWFVEFGLAGTGSRVLRKICWVVYGVVFAVLWYKNMYYPASASSVLGDWGYMYLLIALVAVILLFADGTIQNAIRSSRAQTSKDSRKDIIIANLLKQIDDLNDKLSTPSVANNPTLTASLEAQLEKLEKRVERVQKM